MEALASFLVEKLAQRKDEYAPGIPRTKRMGAIPRVPRHSKKPVNWWFVDHKHEAKRSGLHSDLRLSDGNKAYSWAVKKGLPMTPGEKRTAVRQPDHSVSYISFQGHLPPGYGETKGRGVWIQDQGPARILGSSPDKINFTLLHKRNPVKFTLIRQGHTKWLLANTTPTTQTRPKVPQSKPKYREDAPEAVEKYFSNGKPMAMAAKIDGAHCLPYRASIETLEHGSLPIGLIVNQKLAVSVKSYDGESVVFRPVVTWFKRQTDEELVRVFFTGGHKSSFKITRNHHIMTPDGEVEAGTLGFGDRILVSSPAPGPVQTQALLGMLLGDSSTGYGNTGSKLSRISTTHGMPQEAYCRAKYRMLEDLCRTAPRVYVVDGYVKNGRRIRFMTRSLRGFEPLARLVLVGGIKRVTKEWLDRLDEVSLALWFMDDGSTSVANNGTRKNCQLCVMLHTEGYSEDEVALIVSYFESRWDIRARKERDGRGHYRVAMGNKSSLNFLALVSPFVHPSFEYKMGFTFKDYSAETRALFGSRWREWAEARSIERVLPAEVVWTEPWTWPASNGTAGYVYNIEVEETHNYFVGKALVANCSVNLDKKSPEVYSHRPSERDTGLIDHTIVSGLERVKVPKSVRGARVRSEIFAVDEKGKAVPNRHISGILNASPQKGQDMLAARKYRIQHALLDVVDGPGGKPMSDASYAEKLKVLRKVKKAMGGHGFVLPDMAFTPAEQKKLVAKIKAGKHPQTSEGMVAWRMDQGDRPTKLVLRPHQQVYVHTVYEGTGQFKGKAVRYSYSIRPGGPPVGFVGTGFNDDLRTWMWKNKSKLKGRKAVVKSKEVFPSGALRAPSHDSFHM